MWTWKQNYLKVEASKVRRLKRTLIAITFRPRLDTMASSAIQQLVPTVVEEALPTNSGSVWGISPPGVGTVGICFLVLPPATVAAPSVSRNLGLAPIGLAGILCLTTVKGYKKCTVADISLQAFLIGVATPWLLLFFDLREAETLINTDNNHEKQYLKFWRP